MSIFRSTSSGISGVTVLMAGILSSSPRTRLPDHTDDSDRSTAFLIMPATLSNAPAAAAAVPHIAIASEFPSGVFASGKRDPAATISIVAHAEAKKRPIERHARAAPRRKAAGHTTVGLGT